MAEAGARLRSRLVRRLGRAGVLEDPVWRAAFAEVPRHTFVPVYHQPTRGGGGYDTLRADDPDPKRRARWLVGAYEDVPLVTHVRGGGPVSSSSQPSLMAAMLDALEVHDGDAVLEIGAGTGYNAALLAHRLGDAFVITVDLDEEITGAAREHLAAAGYRPVVVTGDGALGCPGRGPFDRIMATCAMPAIPVPWLEQCAPGGLILAPLASGLVRLRRERVPERAEGHFLATPAYFVALRRTKAEAPEPEPEATRPGPDLDVRERSTHTGPRAMDNEVFRFVVGLAAGELDVRWSFDEGRRLEAVAVTAADRSMASVGRDGRVLLSGPRDLWALVEGAYAMWQEQRRPTRERFGVTVDGERQWVWLDDPAGEFTWPLPNVT